MDAISGLGLMEQNVANKEVQFYLKLCDNGTYKKGL